MIQASKLLLCLDIMSLVCCARSNEQFDTVMGFREVVQKVISTLAIKVHRLVTSTQAVRRAAFSCLKGRMVPS